ncbi:MAG: hypothetical protein U9Q06_00360 [Nanoarchaeota archaeon]|nr:hypothetical protein [Nanoarchaeota archaeon]
MRQSGKVFSLYENPDEILKIESTILDTWKSNLIQRLNTEGYIVEEVKRIDAYGKSYILKYEILNKTEEGLEVVGAIEGDEIFTRDCRRLEKLLEGYDVK